MEKVVIHKAGAGRSASDLVPDIEELLAPLGGIGKYVKPGDKVLLKPNVCMDVPPETAKVTDPEVALAVVRTILAAGASEVWVAESSIIGVDTADAFEAAGYGIFRDMEKVRLIDLKKEGVRLVDVPAAYRMKKLHVFERVFMADVIVNLPKAKTSASAVISMGMKNLKGLIRDDSKRQCHYTNLGEAIVDVSRCIKPSLTIIDALTGCSLLDPIEHGILLAGDSIVALDTVAALCVGVDPQTVKHLCMAEKAGLGEIDPQKIEVIGEKPETVRKEYKKAQDEVSAFSYLYPEISVSAGGACSGCVTVLESVLRTGKEEGWLKPWEGKLRLAIGPSAELPEDGLLNLRLGNCLESAGPQNLVKGCPYLMVDVRDWLSERL